MWLDTALPRAIKHLHPGQGQAEPQPSSFPHLVRWHLADQGRQRSREVICRLSSPVIQEGSRTRMQRRVSTQPPHPPGTEGTMLLSLVLRLGKSPGGGNGTPLQQSCLENPMDRGAWWAAIHRVTKSQTRLKRLSTHVYKARVQVL